MMGSPVFTEGLPTKRRVTARHLYLASLRRGFRNLIVIIATLVAIPAVAWSQVPDSSTLLFLHFENSLDGAEGETPISSTPINYEPGILGLGAYLAPGNQIFYESPGNIESSAGTLEFWIKPRWSGDDGQDHFALRFGGGGGILIGKDAGGFWRIILNRFAAGGLPEAGTGVYITDWSPNIWHHVAFTWNNARVKVYVDGSLRSEAPVGFDLPPIYDISFQLGGDGSQSYLDAVVDELRISDRERTTEEILSSYLAGLDVTSITINPSQFELLETWWKTPELTVNTTMGSFSVPASMAEWASSDSSIASVDNQGLITAISAGTATITATVDDATDSLLASIRAPILGPEHVPIDPFLATPADGYLYEMPVVIIRYFPTTDGETVDAEITNWNSSLDALNTRVDTFEKRVKFILEEGSRFRGYANPNALPSLGYRILDIINIYEEVQQGFEVPWNPGWYRPDYNQILTRVNAEYYVNDLGVKEFWIWTWHHAGIEPAESNMSSPLTGDISNSERRNDDLPIYDHTYTAYNYNFTRTQADAVHNHGHQLEAILSHVNVLQDGNSDLFWKKFVGQDQTGTPITGRCGSTHTPPNTTVDYDYTNPSLVLSDCEDWMPNGAGEKVLVNVDTWGSLSFDWPDGMSDFHQRVESQWYIYWMQNMPGFRNSIPYDGSQMSNWWQFTAHWDAAVAAGMGLHEVPGDFDGNGVVDGSDFAIMRASFGACMGDTRFLPKTDYNGDGCTDYADYRTWYGYYR